MEPTIQMASVQYNHTTQCVEFVCVDNTALIAQMIYEASA